MSTSDTEQHPADPSLSPTDRSVAVAATAASAAAAAFEYAKRRKKVVDTFVIDGRITAIPAKQGKRLLLLDWLAQDFEPGRRYSEPQVNLIIGQRHPDTAALRRYLVDHDFMSREGGVYWRTGGSVD